MKITLENQYLVPSIEFLKAAKLKGTQSLARSKFIKLLQVSLQSLGDAEMEMLKQYGEPEDNSKPVAEDNPLKKLPDGNFYIPDENKQEWNSEHTKLLKQEAEIEGGTYLGHTADMLKVVDDYAANTELAGNDAEVYFQLHEALESATQNDEKEDEE
ncbi:hypothetical protein [Companilactobacillus nodensis]|uniref:Uncharacterized protein n=1 Tax=Companilactobacillus nodensis DSM 19682 = JCM 14932 = NBRC 107160 TaxID=1423775 RepID=A0A0R1KH53_9LACO|nr:hypothetical protein [Companilactobacillus nodensis]KRK80233.1 hypothetical protein FD03_GL002623 [Companilactobacillus nodensis DSM 19682 = JCM 14932 = NBRC 107160]